MKPGFFLKTGFLGDVFKTGEEKPVKPGFFFKTGFLVDVFKTGEVWIKNRRNPDQLHRCQPQNRRSKTRF